MCKIEFQKINYVLFVDSYPFYSGFINGLNIITTAGASAKIVGTIMLLIGLMFAINAVIDFIMLVKVY